MHSPDKRLYVTFSPHGSSISSPKSSSQHFQLCFFISKNEYKAPTWSFHSRPYTAEWLILGWHLIPKAFMFLLTIMCSVPCRLPRDLNILKWKCSHAARMWSECSADVSKRLLMKAALLGVFLWHIYIGAKVPGFMHIQLVLLKKKINTWKAVSAHHLSCKISSIKTVSVTDFVSISIKSPLDVIQALLWWPHFPSGEVVRRTLVVRIF